MHAYSLTIDSFSLGGFSTSSADDSENLGKFCLEGCSSYKESIDIWLSDEGSHIFGIGRSTILDSCGSSDLS